MGMFSGIFGKGQPASTPTTRAAARAIQMDKRIESLRKNDSGSRDSMIRGSSGATSSRDLLTKSLGRAPGPARGSSLGRLTSSNSMNFGSGLPGAGLPPKLPPMQPPRGR
ncbi:MAG: hypothetical protein ABIO72_03380 [Patescibacteria group bacterium]